MIEVEAPDGTIVEFPDGTPRDVMRAAMAKRFGGGQQSDISMLESGVLGTLSGVTMNWGDELGAVLPALVDMFGGVDNFASAYKRHKGGIREMLQEAQQANPNTFLAGEIAGGVPAALIPGGAVARGAGAAQKIGRGIAGGMGYGAVAGAGAGEGLEGTANEAAKGAFMGGVVGGAAVPVGAAVGKVAGKAVNAVSDRMAARGTGVSAPAYRAVNRALKDDAASNPRLAQEIAPDDMLLNAGPNLRTQASAVATKPGSGSARIEKAVLNQKAGEGARAAKAVDDILGADMGRVSNRKMTKAEKKATKQLYDVAKNSGVSHDVTPIKQALQDVDIRGIVPEGVMQRLMNSPAIKDSGPVSSAKLHDFRMLVDDVMGGKFGDSSLQVNAKSLIGDIRKAADVELKAVPGWPQADKAFQVAATRANAFEEGRKALTSALSPDEVAEQLTEFNRVSPQVGEMYRRGVRDSVSRIMGTAGNDAGAAIRELELKGWNNQKMAGLVGQKQAQQLGSYLQKAKVRQDAAGEIIGNSATARRQAAQAELPNPVDNAGRVERTTQGGLQGLVLRPAAKLADKMVGGAISRRADRINNDVAGLLSARGPRAQGIAQGMLGQQASNAARKQALEQAAIAGTLSYGQAGRPQQPMTVTAAPATNIDALARILSGR